MSRIVSASLGPATWRARLADPYLHWRRRKSAWELAVSWEANEGTESGLPPEVLAVVSAHSAFRDPKLLVGLVEHRVQLDTPKTPSQNDIWCVLSTESGWASVAVEGKAGEEFDRRLKDWLASESEGKQQRLDFLCRTLGCSAAPSMELRYQLFHRAASAVLEAHRWGVSKALMLVQSFAESSTSWQDYADFARWLQIAGSVHRDEVAGPVVASKAVQLYLGWVKCVPASDALGAAAV